jgi:hypothetical protein
VKDRNREEPSEDERVSKKKKGEEDVENGGREATCEQAEWV